MTTDEARRIAEERAAQDRDLLARLRQRDRRQAPKRTINLAIRPKRKRGKR